MRAWFVVLLFVSVAGCLDEPDGQRFQDDAGPTPRASDDIIEKHPPASPLWDVAWETVETYRYEMGALEPARNETLRLGPEHVPYRLHVRFYAECPLPQPTPGAMQSHVRFPAGYVRDYDWSTVHVQACKDDPTGATHDRGFHVLISGTCFTGDWTFSLEEGTVAGGLEVVLMKPADPEEAQRIQAERTETYGDPCL